MELLQSYCFHRGKHLCLITCSSGQFLSVNFVFLKLLSRKKKGILLLMWDYLFEKQYVFESENPISTHEQKFHHSQFS